ncbi:MAG: RrF2 family transcriptional regulator [Armatimonadota bacterium]
MISREADYAIRALLRLGLQGDGAVVSTTTLAEDMEIPYRFLRRILRKLQQEGFIASTRGKQGGVRLICSPRAVNLLDIIQAMHPDTVRLNLCVDDPALCNRSARCVVHTALQRIQYELQHSLREVSLAHLIDLEHQRQQAVAV